MVMVAQPIAILLVSDDAADLMAEFNPEAYAVVKLNDAGKALEALRDQEFDIIVLDDQLLNTEIVQIVREVKRRFPLTPVLVLSDNLDNAYQTDLMEAGASDFITRSLYHDELHRRLRLVLQQRRQNRALARRNQNLQALTSLARRLHAATDPIALMGEAINLACRTFRLYGMAIAIREGEMLHIYAGREGATGSELYESAFRAHRYDPFRRVIDSGFVQTFSNIQSDAYFSPIATLPAVESAVILPLTYPEYTYGALAVFGSSRLPLDSDDLVLYELFAAQFTTALQNAEHYQDQDRRVQFSSLLVRAWQRFIALDSVQEITSNLRELVEEVPTVGTALTWLYQDMESSAAVVNASNPEAAEIFAQLNAEGHVSELFEQLDERMQVLLQLGRGQKDPLGPLYRAMRGQQLMMFAISDSARVTGGVIVSSVGNAQFGIEDANLIKSLAHAAGQALVRTMLTEIMGEKGGRLEAILRSIYEGIFFVDNTDNVAFCNTQFAELTGVNPSDVLNGPPANLLHRVSAQTSDPDRTYHVLQDAVNSVLRSYGDGENYIIIDLALTEPDREVNVEFSRISGAINDEYLGWIGIVRDNSRFKSMFTEQMMLFDLMSERIRVPHAELRGLLTTLVENHSRLSNRERTRFLRQMEKNVENLGQLWENFLDMYNLEITGLALDREEVDLYDIIQGLLDSRMFSDVRRQITVNAPARLPAVRVDALRMERALANALLATVSLSSKFTTLDLTLQAEDNQLQIIMQNPAADLTPEEIASLFDVSSQVETDSFSDNVGLGLYLARELVERHGGQLWAESVTSQGTLLTIALPTSQSDGVVSAPPRAAMPATTMPASAEYEPQGNRMSGYSVQKRQPKTIMLVEGTSSLMQVLYDRLDDQGYEILAYDSGEDAIRDVNAVRLDLIAIDLNLSDANGLDICERMRKRSEVPIIMLADEASEAEEVRALKQFGADAFITRPISDDRLMARVDVILKRVADLPTRTREPLDLGELFIDFARREVYLHNKPIELTRIEYDLLHTLAVNENQVLTHKQLLDRVWGPEYQAETQYLWVNVSRLRKKLEPGTDSPRYIHTQQGVGYVFRRP